MFRHFGRLGSRRRNPIGKSIKKREHRFEQLERRDLLAAAIWHNPVFALDVTGDQPARVNALDALRVINWLNNASQPRDLPRQVDFSTEGQYVDTSCDGRVNALDALRIINHLNGVGSGVVGGFSTDGGSFAAVACSPQLLEGSSFATELERVLRVPADRPALEVKFQAPEFDQLSEQQIRDAFEVQIVQADGSPLSNRISSSRTASFNWTEGFQPIAARGMWMEIAQPGQDSRLTFDLSEIPVGTEIRVLARLVNNDSDDTTSVIIRGYEFVELPTTPPENSDGAALRTGLPGASALDIRQLSNLTGMFAAEYDRTSLSSDKLQLVSQAKLTNASSAAILGPIVAVFENFSDPNVFMIRPDGFLADGRPYIDLSGQIEGRAVAGGQTLIGPELGFRNESGGRFQYRLSVYGRLNPGPGGFRTLPITGIGAGDRYVYPSQAVPTIDSPLTYSIVVGPEEMSIHAQTGQLEWLTEAGDVGSHQVVIRATDEFGLFVEQRFELKVVVDLPNRPPIIVSEPEVDSVLSSPFEIQTYATGNGPAAATLVSHSSGPKSIVTANGTANQLGILPNVGVLLGPSQPINLGERTVAELGGVFEGPSAIEIGLVPNTVGQYERDVQQVVAEDINGDGNADAIALMNLRASGNWNDSNDRGFLVTRLGNGDGSFGDEWQVGLPIVPGRIGRAASVHLADVTSDGRKDLVVTTIATNQILVYPSMTGGGFNSNPISSSVTGNYIALSQIADIDRDGELDLVLFENVQVQIGGRQVISIYRGDGQGGFSEMLVLDSDTNNGGNGYVVDVDGVNGPDLVRLNYNNLRVETYLNDGTGSFGARIDSATKSFYSNSSPTGRAFQSTSGYFGDFDSDGKIDALLSGPFGVTLMRGQGDGRFGNDSPSGSVTLLPYNVEWFGIGNTSGQALDLNGDNHLDFLFGNTESQNSLLVGLGIGDGTFELSQYSTAFESDIGLGIVKESQATVFASVADFNKDGVADVLLGNTLRGEQAGSVGLLLGDHPGTFRAAQTLRNFSFDAGFSPTTFGMRISISGDFNNDGILDIITQSGIGFGSGYYFAPGNGDGTFGSYSVVFGGIGDANSLTTLDIDLDGNLDLAWIDGGSFRQAFGLGNGSFQALPSVPAPGGGPAFQNALQVDDFNGDGYPDLVHRLQTGNIDTNFTTRIVVLLYDPVNRRYNTLPDVGDYLTNWPRTGGFYFDESLGIGDLNGDGKKEIFAYSRSITSSNTPARWIILEQTGGPATDASTLFKKTVIENPAFLPHDRSIYSYVVEDFDGDGINDIAYSGNHVHTTVMFGNGDFTFRDATNYYTHAFYLRRGDFNGDGITDLVAMWGWGFLSFSQRPYNSILFGRGDGTFSELNGFAAIANLQDAAVGDFNGDGQDDLAGTALQTHGVAFTSRTQGVSDVASGDLNGDGKPDLVSIISGLDRVKIHFQETDSSFARQADLFSDLYPVDVELLDVDDDQLLDILTANQQARSLSVFRQAADGSFERDDFELNIRPSILRIGDMNGDGVSDLLILSRKDNSINLLTGTEGSFSLTLEMPLGFSPQDLALGDVTGDGFLDLALTDSVGNRVVVLPGRGDGTFDTSINVLGVLHPGSITIADMNRDGANDLIVAQPDAGRVGLLYQRSAGKFTTPQWINVGQNPVSLVADDVNGDGASDVLVVNRGDSTISLILNRFDPSRLWTYQPAVFDPDGDPVALELIDAPGGMLLNPATQTIYWAPMPEQLGSNRVVLEATDGRGGATQQGFNVVVTSPLAQDAPQITSTPVTTVASGAVYRYHPNVSLQDASALRYSLVEAPEGMTIDPTTGEIQWDPRTQGLKLYANSAAPNAPVSLQNYSAIEVPDSPSLRPSSVTVEGWYYFEDPKGALYENLLAKRLSVSNNNLISFGLEYYYGTLRAKIGTPSNNNSLAIVTAPSPVEFRKWTHVAMTFDDTSKTLALWIDGKIVGTALSAESIGYNEVSLQSGRNLAILARQRIWNRALSPEEISQGMLADVPYDSPGLVLQWNFDESRDVDTVFDSSTARNHGYLVGAPDWRNYPVRQESLASEASHEVILRVEDGRGGVAEQAFHVEVVPPFQKQLSGIVFSDLDGDGVRDLPNDFNRIANADFSSGFAGWETDFYDRSALSTSAWLGDSQISVASSSNAIPMSAAYGGHTGNSGQDLMLIVNGDSQDRVAWRQSVSLDNEQAYEFSFWALRPSTFEAARIELRWNGQSLGPEFSLADVSPGTWKQFRTSLPAGAGQGVLEIVSLGSLTMPNPGLNSVENSFAIDDLLLIPASAKRVIVPGTSNPYLSGMPDGSNAYGSTAPSGTPPFIVVQPGQVLRIRASGHTQSDGTIATRSPDGSVHNSMGTVSNALNGISQYAGPNHGSLLGVFLNDQQPSGMDLPPGLDFRSTGNVDGGIDYLSISPELRQLFFIGDGTTSTGIEQAIVVPEGATRLFLANSGTNFWNSNMGSFEVQVFHSSAEPVQEGRLVFLDSNRNQVFDDGEPNALTDTQGRYLLFATGQIAQVGLVGTSGQLQSDPKAGVISVSLGSITPMVNFGSRSEPVLETPEFLSPPLTRATAPNDYRYQVFAQSPLGLRLQYELITGPEGMTIDPVSGLIQWSPNASQAGTHEILIKAYDAQRRFAVQRFPLEVSVNTAPVITSTPPLEAQVGVAWRYQVLAQDAEQSELVYRLAMAPAGMTISEMSGTIDFAPDAAGSFIFQIEVQDGLGGMVEQTGLVTVGAEGANRLPQWIAGLNPVAIIQRQYATQLVARDSDHEPLTYSLVSGPQGLTVSETGQVLWQPTALGSFDVTLAAEDSRGGRSQITEVIQVVPRALPSSFVIQSLPETTARIGVPYSYDVLAPGAVIFELEESPVGMSIDPQAGSIRWIPGNDSLGVVTVRLRCWDLFGNIESQEFSIAVRSSSLVPTISSAPPTQAAVGTTYLYSVRTSNPSSSPLVYELAIAPLGMAMDQQLGEITWTPTAEQLGTASVSLRVHDGLGNYATQSFLISVESGSPNLAPVIESTPLEDAVVGQPFVYRLQATDPEGTDLIYSVRNAPSSFEIDSTTGVVTWTPQASEIGTVSIVLSAADAQNAVAVQAFQVDVRAANRAPEIFSNPTLSVSRGGEYRYDVIAIDPDREPLSYEILEGPEGITIDAFGRIRWQTQLDTPLGGRSLELLVRDGLGATASQSFTFGVIEDTQAPRLTIVVTGEPVLFPWTSHPAIVRVIATDNVGVTGVELHVDGMPVELASDGTARVYFTAPGNGRLTASAFDAAGNLGTAIGRVNMRSGEEDGGGNPAPEANIISVAEGAAVRGFVEVVGTATSPDFDRYQLSYRRIDSTEYKLIHEGNTSVSAGVLGEWDTTLLENDNYILKLEVIDTFGSFAAVEVEVSVTGNLKLGNFRLSFEDLTLPLAGIPITVVRTYDTLRADREGDFGYGWRMEYRETDLRVNLPRSGLEDLGIFTPYRSGTRITMTLPGGQRAGWTFAPEVRVLPGFDGVNNLVLASPRYTPDRGNTATLRAGSGWLTVNPFGELFASGGLPWNPASPEFGGGFTVTTADGSSYFIDGSSGLLRTASDRYGNTLNFSEDRISSLSDGYEIRFGRDPQGRIRSIIDPMGNSVVYRYSERGDLVEVIDRENNSTQLLYRNQPEHYLSEVIDPLGRSGARIDYDPDGRMSSVASGQNSSTSFQYDIENSLVSSSDALGNISLRGYDSDGNIVSLTDPLERTSLWTYDSFGQFTSITTPDGAQTIIERDAAGREISRRSPLGEVTRYTYGSSGSLTGYTDPLGNSWRFLLDAQGNRLEEMDPNGNRTLRTYDDRGRLSTLTDADGYQSSFAYGANGKLDQVEFPNGFQQSFVYDALGNLIRTELSDGQGGEPIVVRVELDRNGRPIATTDAAGNRTISQLSAAGQILGVLDATGRSMSFQYDASGYRSGVQLDENTSISYQYDDNGTLVGQTLPGGNRLRNQVDAAGQVTSVVLPDLTPEDDSDNPRSMMEYDLAGRPSLRQSSNGQVSEWSYDRNGRVTGLSNNNRQSLSSYDAAGRLTSSQDEYGNQTQYEYDAAGRITAIVDWRGRTSFVYDRRGNLVETRDPLGRVRRFEYDSLSRRTAIIEADGDRYEFEYNLLGQVAIQRDPLGRETHYQYDAVGRNTSVTTPGGATTSFVYDAAGRLVRTTRPGNEVVEFEYDAQGRLNEKSYSDGSSVQIEYGLDGQVTSWTSGGQSLDLDYDALGRLIQRTQPNGESLSYEYDALGRIRQVATQSGTTTLEYDPQSRLSRVIDSQGAAVDYRYDNFGRLLEKSFSNGTSEQHTYTATGLLIQTRLVSVEDDLLDRVDYSYDSMGRIVRQDRLDGLSQQFEYDIQDRLVRETRTSSQGSTSVTTYGYDRVGNRVTMQNDLGTTNYEYDADDRLIRTISPSGTTVTTFDAAGRRLRETSDETVVEYTWGPEDRLLGVNVVTTEQTIVIQYGYDPSGNRISRTENGVTVDYLVDEFLYGRSTILEEHGGESGAVRYLSGLTREATIRGGETTYYSTDLRNSPLAATNSQGEIEHQFSWSGFGIPDTDLPANTPGYTGESWDSVTGLVHLRARDYQPASGQFISSDPYPAVKEISESIHRYAYAHQSPTLLTDPSGLTTLPELSTFTQIVGLLAVTTGAIGSTAQSLFGTQKWDGWTLTVAQSSPAISIGLGAGGTYLSHPQYNHQTGQFTTTKAVHLLFFESTSFNVPIPKESEHHQIGFFVPPAVLLSQGIGIGPIGVLLSYFSTYSPIDIAVASTMMFAPKHGDGTGAALVGPYLSIGLGISGGIGATIAFSGLQSSIANRLGPDTISTTFGYSFAIQGFGYGYSKLNTGLTLKPALGASLLVGLSLGFGWESVSGGPSTNT